MGEPGVHSIGYPLVFFSGGSHNPAASTVYLSGAAPYPPHTVATPDVFKIPVLREGHVRTWVLQTRVSGTLGTAEPGLIYLRVNDFTNYALSSTVTWDQINKQIGGDLELGTIFLNRIDTIELYVVTPAWVTAPTGVAYYGQIWVQL